MNERLIVGGEMKHISFKKEWTSFLVWILASADAQRRTENDHSCDDRCLVL